MARARVGRTSEVNEFDWINNCRKKKKERLWAFFMSTKGGVKVPFIGSGHIN